MQLLPPLTTRAAAAAREHPSGRHLPYARHVDDHTVETRYGLLCQVIQVRGLLFETADSEEINYRKRLRDAALQAIGSSRYATYHHIIRREADVSLDADYGDSFTRDLDSAWKARLSGRKLYVNDLFLTLVRRPLHGKLGGLDRLRQRLGQVAATLDTDRYELQQLIQARDALIAALSSYEPRALSVYSEGADEMRKLLRTAIDPSWRTHGRRRPGVSLVGCFGAETSAANASEGSPDWAAACTDGWWVANPEIARENPAVLRMVRASLAAAPTSGRAIRKDPAATAYSGARPQTVDRETLASRGSKKMKKVGSAFAIAASLLASTALTSPAQAQQDTDILPPTREPVDERGVDLSTGHVSIVEPGITIGAGARMLSYQRTYRKNASNPYQYAAYGTSGGGVQIVAGDQTFNFSYNSTTASYTNQQGTGENLTNSGSTWTFTMRDGTVVQMDPSDFDPNATLAWRYGSKNVLGVAHTITFPDQEKWTLTYAQSNSYSAPTIEYSSWIRLQSALSSSGYMAKFQYAANGTTNSTDWSRLTNVTLLNAATDYCAQGADTCTFSKSWPSLTFATTSSGFTVTDSLNRTTTYTAGSGTGILSAIQRPNSSSNDTVISYDANGRVSSVAIDGRTWTYSWALAGPVLTATITNPDATQKIYTADITINQVTSAKDERGYTTSYSYDTAGRLTDIVYPEGNKAHWDYDTRGNVLGKRLTSKTPGTPADIVVSASYPSSCTNLVTCNKPTSATDAKSNVTSYNYDPTHGGLLSVTLPAPAAGAIQPQTRYGYTALQAYFKNSSGSIVASGQPTYVLTSVSKCQTSANCSGTADEAKTTIGYGPTAAPNNLLPATISSGSGDGLLTATTTLTYDDVGNRTYVDGPLAGSADTARTIYDVGRQVVGQIGPDPDGTGPLSNRAVRYSYNLDGQATKVETGTTSGQSDTNWTAFAPATAVAIGYDASGREVTRQLSAGATAYSLTQSSYDANGRLQCKAVRMNTAVYGALPVSACTLSSQGSNGPDQIRQLGYDAAGELTQVQVGVGTAAAANERTLNYNPNGTLASLADANNNVTSYTYDGFDRAIKTTYPGGSTEQVTQYDANGNANTTVNRAGQTFSYSYDNLNRMTSKGGAVASVNYTYDNLNRIVSATFGSGGQGITNTFDQLSRLTSTSSNMTGTAQTLSYQYDLSGNRTQLTYPDGRSLNYDRLVTGEASAIRLNGATSGVGVIATYGYDALGNRTGVTYGDGSSTGYSYDPVFRLASLSQNFAATANNVARTLSYSPASQITSVTSNNDGYAWNGAVSTNRSYAVNSLNQYTNVASSTYTYDGNGNLTSDGSNTFAYDAENHMTSVNNAGVTSTSSYDPLGRLWRLTSGTTDNRYVYDGTDIVALYNQSGLVGDFMFGPSVDEPISAISTGSTPYAWFHADERGSIVGRTDGSGDVNLIQSYDEYGSPGSSNNTVFQYTGQMYLSSIGMYYYKARVYSPRLGRFMQTDPIGYGDGPNWYAYVHNDPVNGTDPLGLAIIVTGFPLPGIDGGTGGGGTNGGSAASPAQNRLERLGQERLQRNARPTRRRSPRCSSNLQALDKIGSYLQLGGLVGGGAATVAGFASGQPEVIAGAVQGGTAGYALGSLIRESVSAANFFSNSGNGSGYTLSQFNDAVLKAVPDGVVHDSASSMLDKLEENEGLTKGDAPICPAR